MEKMTDRLKTKDRPSEALAKPPEASAISLRASPKLSGATETAINSNNCTLTACAVPTTRLSGLYAGLNRSEPGLQIPKPGSLWP